MSTPISPKPTRSECGETEYEFGTAHTGDDGAAMNMDFEWLLGPGGPVEEWYTVDVYTDIPKAFEIECN